LSGLLKGTTIEQPQPAMSLPHATSQRQLRAWRLLTRDPLALLGLGVVVLVVLVALFAPWLAPHDPAKQFFEGLTLEGAPLPPGGNFPLGTDLLGRDVLSRLIYGARVSLIVGVAANAAAGYLQGWVAKVIMRFTDVMMAFPALLLAIALSAILRPSLWIVALVIALVNWVQVCRVVYSQTLALSEQEFVEAAEALGVRRGRILLRHLVPHLIPTMLVWGTLGISTTVLLEATLSFLGVGVQPPMPSWGGIINESQSYFLSAPWLVYFPGGAILLTAVAFNLVGDALRDALDPKARRR
jgi:peptide/nickel transport system permease protein